MSMKVEQFENKNQFVIWGGDSVVFQSYNSTIADYNIGERRLAVGDKWDYSQTTRRHFYLWLERYVGIYLTSKNKRAEFEKMIDEQHATHKHNGKRISIEQWTQKTMDECRAGEVA